VQLIDNQIFETIKLGDEAAYEQLFRTYYPRLCGFAATLVTDREEAEEVVQTLFCRLWEQRDTLEVTTSVQAYLFRAVRNASLNHLKKVKIRDTYKAHNLATMEQNHAFQPDHAVHSELRQALEKAIAGLPEQCRIVFKMSRFEELKYKEIAEKLGISPKTVENQMGKALKVLRLQMVEFLSLVFIFFS
jgi:RNA polymerase sigma-70 factor (family 1)